MLPWLGVNDSSRAGLQPRAHRASACPRAAQRGQRRLQSRALSGATSEDDAGLGGLLGTDDEEGKAHPNGNQGRIGAISPIYFLGDR